MKTRADDVLAVAYMRGQVCYDGQIGKSKLVSNWDVSRVASAISRALLANGLVALMCC